MNCEICDGDGFCLFDSRHGWVIERCDDCKIFESDGDATEYVYTLAKTVVDKVNQMG